MITLRNSNILHNVKDTETEYRPISGTCRRHST